MNDWWFLPCHQLWSFSWQKQIWLWCRPIHCLLQRESRCSEHTPPPPLSPQGNMPRVTYLWDRELGRLVLGGCRGSVQACGRELADRRFLPCLRSQQWLSQQIEPLPPPRRRPSISKSLHQNHHCLTHCESACILTIKFTVVWSRIEVL